jgi:hypothetical protein
MSRPANNRLGRRAILACLAALAAGLLLGRLTAPSPTAPGGGAAPAGAAAARPGAAERPRFPRTPKGAATAVAAYERSFASAAILRPGALRRRIEAVATPAYAKAMLAANSPGARRLATGPIGEGIREGAPTLYSAVPIGYRVESFDRDRARVLTWGFTLLGNASTVPPSAYFGLTHTELRWVGHRWRIAATRGGFGPTPQLGTPPGRLGPYRVLDLVGRLHDYELAP